MSAHGTKEHMSDRRYFWTLVVAAVTLITIVGIIANLVITLHKGN